MASLRSLVRIRTQDGGCKQAVTTPIESRFSPKPIVTILLPHGTSNAYPGDAEPPRREAAALACTGPPDAAGKEALVGSLSRRRGSCSHDGVADYDFVMPS